MGVCLWMDVGVHLWIDVDEYLRMNAGVFVG